MRADRRRHRPHLAPRSPTGSRAGGASHARPAHPRGAARCPPRARRSSWSAPAARARRPRCAALLGAYRSGSTLPASFATLTRASERGELQLILSPQIMKPTPASAPRALRALRRARVDGLAVVDTPRISPVEKARHSRARRVCSARSSPSGWLSRCRRPSAPRPPLSCSRRSSPLGANALAVTHADETDQIGVAVEAACRFGLAPEYMLDRARSGGWRCTESIRRGLRRNYCNEAEARQRARRPSRSQLPDACRDRDPLARPAEGAFPRACSSAGRARCCVAILVPTKPFSASDLEGLVLEYSAPRGRVRLSGTAVIEDPKRARPAADRGTALDRGAPGTRVRSHPVGAPRGGLRRAGPPGGSELHRRPQRRRLPAGGTRHAEGRRRRSSSS